MGNRSSGAVMVDWERVEKLRAKGVDWAAIAADEKVSYAAPEGSGDAGRALKALYYSKKSRGSTKRARTAEQETVPNSTRLKRAMPAIGVIVMVTGLLWAIIAYESSLVSVFLPAYPDVLLVVVGGAVLLGLGVVFGTSSSLRESWKKPIAIGIILGLVIPGAIALGTSSLGVPNLSPLNVSEPGGWQSESNRNPVWSDSNAPVVFYYGSIACPYCSASSWALQQALAQFGTLNGISYGYSNPNDVYANTPEVEFVSASLSSNSISLDAKEGNVDSSTTAGIPPLSLIEQDYLNAYDPGGSIPFFVVGGVFVHVGTLINPPTLSGMTDSQVQQIIANPSSNQQVYNTIHQQQLYLEAFMVKADQLAGVTPPASVTSNTAVMDIVASIS